MKIGYFGSGVWAFALANLLADNGHSIMMWSIEKDVIAHLKKYKKHPRLEEFNAHPNISYTEDIQEAMRGAEILVEGVTGGGVRSVFSTIKSTIPKVPIVLTSKGIEQHTGMLLTDVLIDVLGEEFKPFIGCISGPSLATEVLQKMPTSVVASAFEEKTMMMIQKAFNGAYFRTYYNPDIRGVEFGGAMKNCIAIACGISDGLGYGNNTKAAIMTRGLHEIRRLGLKLGCKQETINGLSGMGDLCLTCMSEKSRNHRLGVLLSQGKNLEEAKQIIGMATEGAYTIVSALELSKKYDIPLPITEATNHVLNGQPAKTAVLALLERSIKEEIV
ncbi:MAG: Glycerol-3-phosphate dehydrogenase [NAD(P)+] [Chlamydiae bacterium]|nr:Glycerol-3-phosphate dehydrogenase [NAD(P)+] [Chlamydiota bacterium]